MEQHAEKVCIPTPLGSCMRQMESPVCSFESESYHSGDEVMMGDQCKVCVDGEWVGPTKVRVPGILVE